MSHSLFGMTLLDQLEHRLQNGQDILRWDAEGWFGGDFNRIWYKTEGEKTVQGVAGGSGEFQALYGRLISPYWDAQVGVRHDRLWEPGVDIGRTFFVLGLEGLAPYRYEVQPALFVSEDGDVSARLTATKDLRITQRLITQTRFETGAAFQDARRFGVRSGLEYVEIGLRLRYEFRRELAPYVGVNWERKLGATAALARDSADHASSLAFVCGLRAWF